MALQIQEILHDFWSGPDRALQRRLAEIWSSWPRIVGQDIADLAKPLGRNKSTLLLGVEDPMVMQEMHFHAPTIMRDVNAALGEKVFDKVRLDLLGARSSLIAVADALEHELREGRKTVSGSMPTAYEQAGVRLDDMNDAHGRFAAVPALERCYRSYVRLLEKMETQQKCPEDVGQRNAITGD